MPLLGLAQGIVNDSLYYQFNEKLDLFDASHKVLKRDLIKIYNPNYSEELKNYYKELNKYKDIAIPYEPFLQKPSKYYIFFIKKELDSLKTLCSTKERDFVDFEGLMKSKNDSVILVVIKSKIFLTERSPNLTME